VAGSPVAVAALPRILSENIMANKRGQIVIPTPLINAAAAGANANDYGAWGLPHGARIVGLGLLPNAAATAHDTNYSVITVSAGGTAIAAVDTDTAGTGSLVAGTPVSVALSGTGTDLELAEDEVITVAKTYAGTGLAVSFAGVLVKYELLV
jgi:hypothetical protein